MNRLAYDSLAREILLLMLESRRLRPVARDRIVAYQVYFFPPRILLELPDADRFEGLLNPVTRPEHAKLLESSILHIVTTEERDSWVVWAPTVEIDVRLGEGHTKPSALPGYEPHTAPRVVTKRPAATLAGVSEDADLLLRLTVNGRVSYLRSGQGLLAAVRGAFTPRVTVFESVEDGPEVASLFAHGNARLSTGDGRVQVLPPRVRIPITHDMTVTVRPTRGRRLWQHKVEIQVEVLGVSRMARPRLLVEKRDGRTAWDRNREPQLEVGDQVGAHVVAAGMRLRLRSAPEDRVEVENLGDTPTWLTWFDGAPLRAPVGTAIPVQGSHLRGLGAGGDALATRLEGAAVSSAPRIVDVHGRLLRPKGHGGPGDEERDPLGHVGGLFGYEEAVASVYQDGVTLVARGDQSAISIPVPDAALVGPLFRVAFDDCMGAKLMALSDELRGYSLDLAPNAWVWVPDVAALALPGLRLRLEVLDRPKLVYGEPQLVQEVTADPDDRWQLQGWRFRIAANGLAVNGSGRVGLEVDRQRVEGPTLLPPASEHHVEAGPGLYRIVRRRDRAAVAGRGA